MNNMPCIVHAQPLIFIVLVINAFIVCRETDAITNEVPSTRSLLSLMDHADGTDVVTVQTDAAALFGRACSQCHDTSRATSKQKSYEAWMLTVSRMADKPGANIAPDAVKPIAGYLASLSQAEPEYVAGNEMPSVGEMLAASSVTLNATVSLLWRKGDQQVENEGFFPDIWVGVEWHPQNNPFSIQVMACTTCHDDGSNGLNAELLEGSFRADLIHLATGRSAAERTSEVELVAKAGRFVVPFGAFSGMVHPGVYRTLTNPLMYNMGRRVGYYEPVLPMPYADEGMNLNLGYPLPLGLSVHIDGYAVNGLQEGGFTPSRSYKDNNSNAALGTRAALANTWFSIGGSYATGELQGAGTPTKEYMLTGGDLTLRYLDRIRLYYEYARREEDTTTALESSFSGDVIEVEGEIWRRPKISLLARYDTIRNSPLYGDASIERFTWGPNITLRGGSVLILNHEHWKHDAPLNNEDIIGFRWIVSL